MRILNIVEKSILCKFLAVKYNTIISVALVSRGNYLKYLTNILEIQEDER